MGKDGPLASFGSDGGSDSRGVPVDVNMRGCIDSNNSGGKMGKFDYQSRGDLKCRTRFVFDQPEEVSAEMWDRLDSFGSNLEVLNVSYENLWVYQIGDCSVKLGYSEQYAEINIYNEDSNKRNVTVCKLEEIFF
jgi:hypothetical protein